MHGQLVGDCTSPACKYTRILGQVQDNMCAVQYEMNFKL